MRKKWLWDDKPWQAFKNFAIIFSFVVNLILIIVILLVAPLVIPITNDVAAPLVGGLNDSFVEMGNAHIVQTIEVDDTMPISFTLPLATQTTVVLAAPVPMEGVPATFSLPGGGGTINGEVSLNLPEGMTLPVLLDLDVPVNQDIPVKLAVPVDIALSETELGAPFARLQSLFLPIDNALNELPASDNELQARIVAAALGLETPVPDGQATPMPLQSE